MPDASCTVSLFVLWINFNIICLSTYTFPKLSLSLWCPNQIMYIFISHAWHMPRTHLIHLHLIIITIFSNVYKSHIPSYDANVYILPLLPLSFMSKYVIITFYLTLSLICVTSNEIRSLTDAFLLWHQKHNVSYHPSILWHYSPQ